MRQELENKAMELFDTAEKWNSFLELVSMKNNLVYTAFKKLKQELMHYFNANPVDKWICEPWGDTNVDLSWYLKDFGINSLALRVGWRFEFHLQLNDTENYNSEKINNLLKTSEFSPLLAAFENAPDRQFENQTKAMEYRHYSFGSPYDNNFDNSHVDHLSWYAFYETKKFAEQIIRKVERVQKPD